MAADASSERGEGGGQDLQLGPATQPAAGRGGGAGAAAGEREAAGGERLGLSAQARAGREAETLDGAGGDRVADQDLADLGLAR